MKRAVILALLFAVAVGVTLPLLSSEASRLKDKRAAAAASRKKVRKYSRAWWRRYYARLRRKRTQQGRKRVTPNWYRRSAVAPENRDGKQTRDNHRISPLKNSAGLLPEPGVVADSRGGVFADPNGEFTINLPDGWSSRPVMVNGERRFMVFGPNGQPVGQASLSSAWARNANDDGGLGRNRSLGGIPLRELRRSVIDKMAATNGWVVSDGEQEVNGRRVFVVNAQTGTSEGKAQQNWTYYFTEANGHIYSLTTNAPVEYSDQLSNDSNHVLNSFGASRSEAKKEEQ